MKRLYILLFTFLISSSLWGQITVSNAVFPQAGDTLFTRIDVTPMINFQPKEGMQNWVFNGLSSPALVETIFRDPDFGSSTFFNNANMVNILDNGPEYYYRADDTSFVELGYYGVDPFVGFIMVNARYSQPLILRHAPLNFGDVHQQSTDLLIPISSEIIPDTLLSSLPVRPDSLRLRVGIQRNDTVSAFGTLTLNQVNFEVLQEKRIEERSIYFDAKVPFLGWQDITQFIATEFPQFGAGTMDTITSYYYFSEGVQEPVAVVNVDDRDTPQRVEFKDMQVTSSTRVYNLKDIEITASPNPGIGLIEFRVKNAPLGNYKVKVRNIIGQSLWEKSFFIQGKEELNVDLTHLKRGTYFYTLIDENGNSLITKRLIIIRA